MPNLESIAKVFTVVPDAMVLVNSRGEIVIANDHTYKLFGHPAGTLAGRLITCLIPERFALSHDRHVSSFFQVPSARAMGTGMELSARRSDNSEFDVEVSLSPFRTEEEVYAMAAIRDITERRHLEEARSESQRQKEIAEERAHAAQVMADTNETLRAIFEASPHGIITATKEGKIDRWNRAAEKIYGYAVSESLGMSVFDFSRIASVEDDLNADAVFAEISRGRELRDFHLRQRRKDGRIVEVSVDSAPFHSVNGEQSGFVFLVDDISERKAIEQQLRQSQKMEAIGQLTGGIAHDFNNLLSIIICNLELLLENLPRGSEDRELGSMALEASLRGADLIKQIMAFSRKQNLLPQRVVLTELVQGMINLLGRSLGEHIEIILETEGDLWPAVVDPLQLQTAIANLATNARDAMPDGGSLVIQTGNARLDEAYVEQFSDLNPGDYVRISVTDTGKGMPPEIVERAFDPFFTTKPAGEGTGLGLSMVFGFAKQSGGHIRIYSEEEVGTTVRLYLPRASSEDAEITPQREPEQPRKLANARILIVEDNQDLAKSAHRVLSQAGYMATTASTAEAALSILRSDAPFDLLFTDIILAHGKNGIELSKEATRLMPTMKTLFASGFSEAALRATGKAVVQNRFIAKPYQKTDLLKKIAELIEG